jgi:hypothetical protein
VFAGICSAAELLLGSSEELSVSVNPTEEFAYRICRKTFLSIWSTANPRAGDPRKELCDILVVCDPHIVIISVKERLYEEAPDRASGWRRWQRKAIDASARQIYGAERELQNLTHVIHSDGSLGLPLPQPSQRVVHRIAVALGGNGKVPLYFGDLGKGFVHVLDEVSFSVLLQELDTVSDLLEYLGAKEELDRSGVRIHFEGAEEDLLALYLHQGCSFPSTYTDIVVGDSLWAEVTNKAEFKRKKQADHPSYVWDSVVENLCRDYLTDGFEFRENLTETEMVIRTMARESRFNRRILGSSFQQFLQLTNELKIESRITPSPSGNTYVFLCKDRSVRREDRLAELSVRCFIARSMVPENQTVIGLSLQLPHPDKDTEVEIMYLNKPEWTDEDEAAAESGKLQLGFFSDPITTQSRVDEYPPAEESD